MTIQPFDYLVASAAKTPDAVALATPEVDMTYGELLDTARRFAYLLREAGLQPGQSVAVVAPALVEMIFVHAIFHEAAIGSIPPAGYRLSDGWQHDWVVTEAPIEGISPARQILLTQATLERLGSVDLGEFEPHTYESPESPCRIAFSSGTTGRPKAIPFSIASIDEKCTAGRERWMVGRPFMSALGLGSIVSLLALYACAVTGDTFVYPGDQGEATLEQLRKHGIAVVAMSPHQLGALLTTVQKRRQDLPDLKTILVTGSPLPDFMRQQAERLLKVTVVVLYASTEAGSVARRVGAPLAPGHVGQIEPDVTVRILDESGTECADGETGLIAVTRELQPQTYLGDEQAVATTFRDGLFISGDTGYVRGNDLFLAGRRSELINAAGVKVDPALIDEVALQFPGIDDAGAFGFTNQRGLDVVGLVFSSPETLDVDEYLAYLRRNLGESAPSHLARVPQVPRNPNGKLLRDDVSRLFSQRLDL